MQPTFAPTRRPTLSPTLNLVLKSFLGHKYCDISLIMAQSAFLCSLFETVCSASRGSFFVSGFAASLFLTTFSGPTFSSAGCFCAVLALASSFLCRGVVAKTRFACHDDWNWSAIRGLESGARC